MSGLVIVGVALLAAYALAVIALTVSGRRSDARALAGFVPDCIVLLRRIAGDERVSRPRRWLVGAAVLYLVFPLDVVPDFIPVAGQLDDVIVVGMVLRGLLKGAGPELIAEHWPGPRTTLDLLLRFGGR